MSQFIEELKLSNSKNNHNGDEGKSELSMAELLAGMANQEFFFHHQPIFDMLSGNQIGSEMLIRWMRRGKIFTPMWFMPMIERHGLNVELDQYVIRRFWDIPWEETAKPDFLYRVFINISAQSFIDPSFFSAIIKATEKMQENGIIPVLELSERTACEIGLVQKQMGYLQSCGAEIALDDFGIGFSSLSRLIELPIDIIKIDRGIINLIGLASRAETIIHTVFQMAKELNITVIAEGVETEDQSNWLVENGDCWAQGFYYARPTLTGFASNSNHKGQEDHQIFGEGG
ncbi:MAG: EAL domain-containing protein [Anaerolineaceae bacterium]|nr:EAL domain-containing protein [Anaerolineaceae bacterium]